MMSSDVDADNQQRFPLKDCERNYDDIPDVNVGENLDINENQKSKSVDQSDVVVEADEFQEFPSLIHGVEDSPPLAMTILLALQQGILSIARPMGIAIIVAEIVCAGKDEALKIEVMSATLLMTGLSTFVMTTFGVRLPIFQGPANSYIVPLVAMANLKEWRCPSISYELDPATNTSLWMASLGNGTFVPARDVSTEKIAKLSGSLVVAGLIHFLIGLTGVVGLVVRYVGPVTIVPTIVLIGLNLYKLIVKFSETNWIASFAVLATNITLSLFLGNKKTPIPWWNRRRGFHIFWYPLHRVMSVLISIVVGWVLSVILTESGSITNDPDSRQYLGRTDSRTFIIDEASWFMLPYPGKLSHFDIALGAFINFFVATLLSVLDSIGDYTACARTCRVRHPPPFAFNRGIAIEGLMSVLGGSVGCCHATVSFGGNIGAIGLTKVASRRVFQCAGLIYIAFAICGKFGAVFISVPYSVLGGALLITTSMFVGVVLSYLQTINLNSTRNVAIIGLALLLGLMLPYWVKKNGDTIDTGSTDLDGIVRVLLSNPSFVCGFFAFAMDNLVPGTQKERGLKEQISELEDDDDYSESVEKEREIELDDGYNVYRLTFLPKAFTQSRLARILPIFDYVKPNKKTTD